MHYPWAPDETPQPDPLAERLRLAQRQFGTEGVRSAVLGVIGQYQSAGLPDQVVARKLDVPPALIARWRDEHERDQIERQLVDPKRLLTREFAALEQRERLASQKLLDPKIGTKQWSAAMAVLNQVARQRAALRREAGITLEAPLPEPPDDCRHLGLVASLKGSLASFCVAVGIDPETSFEDAIDQLPEVFDANFGPVGSPGREEAARIIKRGLNGWKDDEEPTEPDNPAEAEER